MNNKIYKLMCLITSGILTLGSYINAGALSAPIAAQSANIYYVSIAGNDTNTGIETAPWKTIQKAVNTANPGDTILVRAGTYNENIIITRSGSSGNVIKLTNYPNEVVEINGGSGMALHTRGAIGYWTIEGLRFKSTNEFAIRFGWFYEAITNHMTLRNNYINGTVFTVGNNQLFEDNEMDGAGYTASGGYGGINDSHGGFGDDATHHNIYRNNYIHDFTNYNARGIWTQGRTHDNLIEFNRVENIWTTGLGQCIDLDAGAGTLVQWRHKVTGNKIKDCNYVGIQLENVFDSLVENNIIFASKGGSAGIIVINYSPTIGCGVGGENNQYGDTNGDNSCKGDITNNIIRQNLIYKNGSWGWGYGGLVNWGAGGLQILGNTIYASGSAGNAAINFQSPAAETSQSIIQNNILYNGNGSAICALSFDSFIQDSNNLLYKTTVNGDGVYGSGTSCAQAYSLSSYKTATGKGENSIQAEPQFVSITDYNFHLSNSSPAIDKGLNIGLKTDFDGNPRPQGNGFDIGAYEFLGINTVTFTPIVTETPVITGTPVITATPVTSNTPIATGTPTSTNTPVSISTALPTGSYVATVVTPQSLILGEAGLVTVSLNNVPPEGFKSAEFTCTYTPDLIEVSNITIADLFGADPVSALNGPQNGSFIVAIAGSNDNKAMTSGTVFTFNATGLQVGQTGIECKARVSKGDNILENILSIPDTLTILGNSPTATPIAAPLLTGQVLASKPVTIRLFNPDASLAATTTANADGTFSLTASAGVYTIIASAEGYLDSQGSTTLVDGVNTVMPVVNLPAGDIDNNDVIDQFDAMTLGMNYNISAPAATELNNDGVTNILDLEMLAENYRKSGALAWQ